MSAFLSIWPGLRVKAATRMDFSTKSWCRSQGQWRSITSKSLDIAAAKPTYSSPPASGGVFEADGRKIFFKIDYFDKTLTYHSPDPSDASVTERVITIMLAEEY